VLHLRDRGVTWRKLGDLTVAESEYRWTRVDEWPEAPRGGAAEVEALVDRLRATV
jgi:hypothetical protein